MKRAVILHAMEQTSKGHWYPWLKTELKKLGYKVWLPDLPTSEQPDAKLMTEFLLGKDWDWSENIVIGHSSGAVEILYLLPELKVNIKAAVLLGSFDHALWEDGHTKLFPTPVDYVAVKRHTDEVIVMHGDDDPWCPIDGAEHIAEELDGELIIVHGAGHFSTSLDPKFTEIPQLLEILDQRELL